MAPKTNDFRMLRKAPYFDTEHVELSAAVVNFTANGTTTVPAGAPCHVGFLDPDSAPMIVCGVVPADADGTFVATLKKWDASAGAAVALSAATDLETLITVAKKGYRIPYLTTLTDDQMYVDVGDSLYYEVVNNSAAIDTQPSGCVVRFHLLIAK